MCKFKSEREDLHHVIYLLISQLLFSSVSERLSAPLSDSFSRHVLLSYHEKNVFFSFFFTFSVHSAATSSGCLFKDNEASLCSLKSSVSRTALVKQRSHDIIFFLLLSLK